MAMTGSSETTVKYIPKNTLDLSSGLGYKILYRPIIKGSPIANPLGDLLPVFPRRFPRYFLY